MITKETAMKIFNCYQQLSVLSYFVHVITFSKEVIMLIIKSFIGFILNGFGIFKDASHGSYKNDAETISKIRKEMIETEKNRVNDRKCILEDRKNVGNDMRKSFNRISLSNGNGIDANVGNIEWGAPAGTIKLGKKL